MKTTKSILLILALAAAVSCVKEDMDPQVSAPEENVAFTGVRSNYGGTKTKTVLTEDYKVLWDKDDAIAVWDGTEIYRIENGKGRVPSENLRNAGWNVGYKYSVTTETNSASTGFKYSFYKDAANHIKDNYTQGTADAEGVLVENFKDISEGYELASETGTWYLMNSNFNVNFIANYEAKQFRAWLSNNQKLPVGTFVDSRDFAVAKTQDLSQPVVFKNAVSLLEFVIPTQMDGKISKITVNPNASGEYLAGDLLIDYSGDAPKTSLWALSEEHNTLEGGKSQYATLTLTPEKGTAFASGKYYAVVCPCTLTEGLTVNATLTTGMTLTRSSEKSCTFKESYVYGMGEIDAASESYSNGVNELPYVFSLYATAGTGNTSKYLEVTKGGYDGDKNYFEHTYVDNDHEGVVLYCRGAGDADDKNYIGSSAYYSNNEGADNIPAGSFVSPDSAGDAYIESYYKLKMSLAVAMPSSFRLTFGMGTNSAAIRDWKIMYSNDDKTWYEGASYALTDGLTSWQYFIYNVTVNTSELSFGPGDIMYLKWIPTGNRSVRSSTGTTTGWNSAVRLWGGIVISDVTNQSSPILSGCIYQDTFDRINGGVDYIMGEKIGYLSNAFGSSIEKWTEEQKGGLTGENIVMRPGYVQVGTVSLTQSYDESVTISRGTLTTPKLNSVGNLTLGFRAMAFKSYIYGRTGTTSNEGEKDATSIVITLNAGTFEDGTQTKTVEITSGEWGQNEVNIKNATADTQVTFSSPEDATYTRWFLDDICVTKAQ